MKYDFDKVVPRRGTNSYKWDLVKQDDVIPLWVADMDFAVAPPIQEALRKRMEHPVFGYGSTVATTGTSRKTGSSTPPVWCRP